MTNQDMFTVNRTMLRHKQELSELQVYAKTLDHVARQVQAVGHKLPVYDEARWEQPEQEEDRFLRLASDGILVAFYLFSVPGVEDRGGKLSLNVGSEEKDLNHFQTVENWTAVLDRIKALRCGVKLGSTGPTDLADCPSNPSHFLALMKQLTMLDTLQTIDPTWMLRQDGRASISSAYKRKGSSEPSSPTGSRLASTGDDLVVQFLVQLLPDEPRLAEGKRLSEVLSDSLIYAKAFHVLRSDVDLEDQMKTIQNLQERAQLLLDSFDQSGIPSFVGADDIVHGDEHIHYGIVKSLILYQREHSAAPAEEAKEDSFKEKEDPFAEENPFAEEDPFVDDDVITEEATTSGELDPSGDSEEDEAVEVDEDHGGSSVEEDSTTEEENLDSELVEPTTDEPENYDPSDFTFHEGMEPLSKLDDGTLSPGIDKESGPLYEWKQARKTELAARRKRFEEQKKVMEKEAKQETKEFFVSLQKTVASRQESNRAEETEYRKDQNHVMEHGTLWEQVARLVDLKADTSSGRMRNLLIQLKNQR